MKSLLFENPVIQKQAKSLGLSYYHFGRYGKEGKVTHESRFGRLVPVKQHYDPKRQGEKKLTHLEHLDDAVFNNGSEGVYNAIDVLLAAKHADERVLSTVKLDGSPSLVIKNDNGRLAVATKSAFNKNPKINYTPEDVDANHGHAPGLVQKLKAALEHLPKIHPHGMHQSDVLFSEEDKKIINIDGVPHITFRPNTIRYAVPLESEMGQKIQRAKFGVAIHSKYNEHGTLEPAHDSQFSEHPDVFVLPVSHAIDKYENPEFDAEVKKLGMLYRSLHPVALQLASSSEWAPLFKQYVNSRVKDDMSIGNADDFIDWFRTRGMKEIDKVKTEAGKHARRTALQQNIQFLMGNAHHINGAFAVSDSIRRAKEHLVRHFNQHVAMKHYLDSVEGLKKTDPEGFVIHSRSGPIKFVNRAEFSRANFQMSKNR